MKRSGVFIPPLGQLKRTKFTLEAMAGELPVVDSTRPVLDFSALDLMELPTSSYTLLSPTSIKPTIMNESQDVQVLHQVKPAVSTRGFTLENLPSAHHHLGDGLFVVVSDFTDSCRVHLRQYTLKEGQFFPSKHGITFSPCVFLKLTKKIFQVANPGKTQVIGNELFFSTTQIPKGYNVTVQRMYRDGHDIFHFTPVAITMTHHQFSELEDICGQVWQSIIEMQFGSAFKKSVLQFNTILTSSSNDCDMLKKILIDVVRNIVLDKMLKLADCFQCSLPILEQPLNQLGHECCNITRADLCKLHFDTAVALLQPKEIGKAFAVECRHQNYILSDEFFDNLNVMEMLEGVLTLCSNDW